MKTKSGTVFVVDDEEQARESVCALVQSMHHPVQAFASAEEFLEFYDGRAGCLVTDYRMAGMNGLELQAELLRQGQTLPVVVVTAFARTPVTVQAIQSGAVTMLDKPYSEDDLWTAIREGLTIDEQAREAKQQRADITQRLESLNEKEKVVLDMIVAGQANKAMAQQLKVSLRTIENRRRAVFAKVGAQNVAELVSLVVTR